MEYEIILSDTCLEEIEEICEYIEKKLKAEQSANRLREEITTCISNLRSTPKIYATIDKKDRQNRSYRKVVIGNYVILYIIIEEDGIVFVAHMYYGKRNYMDGGWL